MDTQKFDLENARAFICSGLSKEEALKIIVEHSKTMCVLFPYGNSRSNLLKVMVSKYFEDDSDLDSIGYQLSKDYNISPSVMLVANYLHSELDQINANKILYDLFSSIKIGSNTLNIFYQFMHWALSDPKHGLIQNDDQELIQQISNLYLKAQTEPVPIADWDRLGICAYDWARRDGVSAAGLAALSFFDLSTIEETISLIAHTKKDSNTHLLIMRDKLFDLFNSDIIKA